MVTKINLYEIQNELLSCVDEDGEIIDIDKLDKLNIEFNTKVGNIARWIVNLDADIKAYKERKEVFAQRQKVAENKKERLKMYLSSVLDGRKWQDEDVRVSWRKSQSVDVFGDPKELPEEFVVVETTYKPDKTKIKNALKDGEIIEGCKLVDNNNINIK